MIGQQISLEVLVPIAVDRLRDNPLVEGDYYEGDLLCSVLRVPAPFWRQHPALCRDVLALIPATPAAARRGSSGPRQVADP